MKFSKKQLLLHFHSAKSLPQGVISRCVRWMQYQSACTTLPFRSLRRKFYNYFESHDILEQYLALIKDLSPKSVENVNSVISRINKIAKNRHTPIVLSNKDRARRKQYTKIKNSICKVAENVYAYNQYILPVDAFEACVFADKHYVDHLSDTSWMQRNILDIGGFIGDSALVFAYHLKEHEISHTKIHSFEGMPTNYEYLQKTIKLNRLPNIEGHNVLLGDCDKEVYLTHNEEYIDSGSRTEEIGPDSTQKKAFSMTSLDAYAQKNSIDNIGLIKVDIEGAEQIFLKGARKTIEKNLPVLLLSIYHSPEDFFEIKPMIESWNLGYTFQITPPQAFDAVAETLLICEPPHQNAKF